MAEFPDSEGQMLTNVFVYGSLKRGYALHACLEGQMFLGECQTAAKYRLLDCGSYPALVRVALNGVSVKGELYGVDAACLTQLDIVEAVDAGLYERGRIQLDSPFNLLSVQAYFYLQSTSRLRDCGNCWPAGT